MTSGEKQTVFKEEAEEEKNRENVEENKTSSGLDQNIAGVLCYLLGFITGIIFILIEKENRFVRFHAMQSIMLSIAFFVAGFVLTIIPLIGWIFAILITPVTFILWIFMMWKAYSGEWYKLPVIGDFAENQIDKETN